MHGLPYFESPLFLQNRLQNQNIGQVHFSLGNPINYEKATNYYYNGQKWTTATFMEWNNGL
jgi:hypothetical protein